MLRMHGKAPYRVAVVHGGPGALGSVACVAEELSPTWGVLEPLQTKRTIPALIEELHGQLCAPFTEPYTLIGHSFGAWLIALYASQYPYMVKRLVLVGCAPFMEKYVPQIHARRMDHLSIEEQTLFTSMLQRLENADVMEQFEALMEKSDAYQLDRTVRTQVCFDAEQYASVWEEAARMRSDGSLLQALQDLICPIAVIHGTYDPHPFAGVIEPLQMQGVHYEAYVLEQCGHAPFQERYARKRFYQLVNAMLLRDDMSRRCIN